jgi:hypothetical protein
LNWPLGFPLHDDGSTSDLVCLGDIYNPQPDQVASAQLAVDGQIEKRKIAQSAMNLETHTDGPDFTSFQGWFLAGDLTFVPRNPNCVMGEQVLHDVSPLSLKGEPIVAKWTITGIDPFRN